MQHFFFLKVFVMEYELKLTINRMFKNFLTNAFRNMRRQSGYIVLNVLGLAIGLTSFLFIALYVINELS